MTCSLPNPNNLYQLSIIDLKPYSIENQWAALLACAKGNELIGIIAKQANDTIIALSKK
jgi:hypothetical protein